jgi:hypothetical protein
LFDGAAYQSPDIKPRAPRTRKRYVCCKAWAEFTPPTGETNRWFQLHALAHSRVAFTDGYAAEEVLRLSLPETQFMTRRAKELGWIAPTRRDGAARRGSGLMWIGALTARRR